MNPIRDRHRGLRAALAIAPLFLLALSCVAPVPFHERRLLADPAMAAWTDAGELHWHGKVIQSMEGSIGDVGTAGGGGCGCY